MSAPHERRRQRKWEWEPCPGLDVGRGHGWRADRRRRRGEGCQYLERELRCPCDPHAMPAPHRSDGMAHPAFRKPSSADSTASPAAVTCPSPDGTVRTGGSRLFASGAPFSTMGWLAASCWSWRDLRPRWWSITYPPCGHRPATRPAMRWAGMAVSGPCA